MGLVEALKISGIAKIVGAPDKDAVTVARDGLLIFWDTKELVGFTFDHLASDNWQACEEGPIVEELLPGPVARVFRMDEYR